MAATNSLDQGFPFAEEAAVVVTNAVAVTLDSAVYSPGSGPSATQAMITVENGLGRFWATGSTPTDEEGHRVSDGSVINLTSAKEIENFEIIAVTGDIVIQVTYNRVVQ